MVGIHQTVHISYSCKFFVYIDTIRSIPYHQFTITTFNVVLMEPIICLTLSLINMMMQIEHTTPAQHLQTFVNSEHRVGTMV